MHARFLGKSRLIAGLIIISLLLGLAGSPTPAAAAEPDPVPTDTAPVNPGGAEPTPEPADPEGGEPSSTETPPDPLQPEAVFPTTWNPLTEKGLGNLVNAIAIRGTNVYVGGRFTSTNDNNTPYLDYIARYDTTDGSWHSLGIGLNNYVNAIAINPVTGFVYVGGDFTGLSNNTHPELAHIAMWNGVSWMPLFPSDLGLNGSVQALAFDTFSNDLWVGGSFTDEVDNPLGNLNHIARFNTLGTVWNPTQCKGLNADVKALAISGSNLYVGGSFSQTALNTAACANADKAKLNKIAKYSGGTVWTALTGNGLLGLGVNTLAADVSGNIYVGGSFSGTADSVTVTNMHNFGIYSQAAWIPPATFHNGLVYNSTGNVNSLLVVGTDVYVGGRFTTTYDNVITGLNNLVIYRAGVWISPPSFGLTFFGGGGEVDAMGYTIGGSNLFNVYAAGAFDQTGDGLVKNAYNIAVLGNTCNANASGNWNSTSTWSCGEVPTTADKVTIPQNMVINLNVNTTINGNLVLNGVIDATKTGSILTLGPNVVMSGAGEIYGIVQRLAPAIGAALYYNNARTALTFYGSSPTTVKVQLLKGNPGGLANYVGRKYIITPAGGSGWFADLQLAYNTNEFVHITSEANMKLYRLDPATKTWKLKGGTVDTLHHWVKVTNSFEFGTFIFLDKAPVYKVFVPFFKR